MRFPSPLLEGRLLRRYQRFLADVDTAAGIVTAHCPNTGSMQGCAEAGMRVWLSPAANPARKLAWTWELVEALPGTLVGVHTGRSNALVREAIEAGRVPELAGYPTLRPEVKYGENSRIDLLLQAPGRADCYVEVKNVTAAVAGRIGYFPDAVTARGGGGVLVGGGALGQVDGELQLAQRVLLDAHVAERLEHGDQGQRAGEGMFLHTTSVREAQDDDRSPRQPPELGAQPVCRKCWRECVYFAARVGQRHLGDAS